MMKTEASLLYYINLKRKMYENPVMLKTFWSIYSRWEWTGNLGFSYWYTGIDVPILVPKKGKYTLLYTDIFFFRLIPQFKIKENLFPSKKK